MKSGSDYAYIGKVVAGGAGRVVSFVRSDCVVSLFEKLKEQHGFGNERECFRSMNGLVLIVELRTRFCCKKEHVG